VGDSPADRVTLARILRPHGRRGEVAAEILTDFPERLTRLKKAMLWDGSNPPREAAIRGYWLSKSRGGQAIFHFEESHSISDAEKLVGLEVQVPLGERLALPGGTYYVTDLIGCEVFESSDGTDTKLGAVRDVQLTGENGAGTPILVVDGQHGELLIPLAADICRNIDTVGRRIEVALPEGLLDLNRTKSNR
jgi:16S rRNA processing protein RimM